MWFLLERLGGKEGVLCVRKYGFNLEGGEWFKEGFRKLFKIK